MTALFFRCSHFDARVDMILLSLWCGDHTGPHTDCWHLHPMWSTGAFSSACCDFGYFILCIFKLALGLVTTTEYFSLFSLIHSDQLNCSLVNIPASGVSIPFCLLLLVLGVLTTGDRDYEVLCEGNLAEKITEPWNGLNLCAANVHFHFLLLTNPQHLSAILLPLSPLLVWIGILYPPMVTGHVSQDYGTICHLRWASRTLSRALLV